MKDVNFLVSGVGGQGTLLASDILAEVGMRAGYDVKKSDVLGLAIRGGSVLSHVRWGDRVASPVVRDGQMNWMLAFEPLEALRGLALMHPSSTIVCNVHPIPPISVSSGQEKYPEQKEIEKFLAGAAQAVHYIDATREAVNIGNSKVANVIMLGAFSALLSVESGIWEDVILSRVPSQHIRINQDAFRAGHALIGERGSS